jgi:hypothetical protein
MSYVLDTPFSPIIVYLRSSNYSSITDHDKNNLRFDLNAPIESPPNVEVLVSLHSFSFTNSFYNINTNNCNFYYTIDNTHTISTVIPNGNYDVDSLVNTLNSLFIDTFVFTYSVITLKITITSIIPFRLVSGQQNIYEILGFDDVNTSTVLNASYTSPYLFNMIGIQCLNICVNNLNIKSIGVKNSPKYNIIDNILVSSVPGEVQHYCNCDNFRYAVSDDLIDFLNISVFDQDFRMVDFNNIDWFMSVKFEFVYKKSYIMPTNYLSNEEYYDNQAYYAYLAEKRHQLLNEMKNNKFST